MRWDRTLRVRAGRASVALALAVATATCVNPADPTPDVRVYRALRVALTGPAVPFTVPAGSTTGGALSGRFTIEVDPKSFRPDSIQTNWTLTVDPPSAGSVSPAQGVAPALPRSQRLADPFYDGSFDGTFTPAPGVTVGTVRVTATVTIAETDPAVAERSTLDIQIVPSPVSDTLPPPPTISCEGSPRSGTAPLSVRFDVSGRDCQGHCEFRWDFGDGDTADAARVTHVYAGAGSYTAVGRFRDSARGVATCAVPIVVEPPPAPNPAPSASPSPTPSAFPSPTPSPSPSPSPAPNQPPSIAPIVVAASPPNPLAVRVTTTITDPDPGDTIAWVIEVIQAPPGSTATATPASGSGSSVSSLLTLSTGGIYTVRITATDGRGGTDTEQRQFEAPL